MSGTFTLSIAGTAINVNNVADIPYDVSASTLQSAIRASGIVGFDYVEVVRSTWHGVGYKATWMIKYREFKQAVPSITVSGASLTGGSSTPTIEGTTRRAYSPNLVFDPIDYRHLHTDSNSINVLVTTNGVPSVCTGSCAYSFNTYTEVTSLSYSGSGTTLNFALSDPTTINFAPTSVSVSVGGQPCNVDGGSTLAAMTCTMSANTDSTPILVAGQVTPVISVPHYGIAGLASGVTPLTVGLSTTSLTTTSGGDNGGYLISLNGAGFPLDKSKITIEVCSKNATVKSVTNIKVDFYIPKCGTLGAQNVIVKVGSNTDNAQSFTYVDGSGTAPTITNLIPASANPGLKGTLEIHGDKFGTDSSIVKVFLSNATGKIYELSVLQMNNTYVKVGLPGGLEGAYKVEVNLQTNGDSISLTSSDNFNYAFSISSVTPNTGSINGGTLLTITG